MAVLFPVLGPGALGRPRGIGWRGRWEGGSGWGIHVYPWLIHVYLWQKPLQYCKVISLQLKKKKKNLQGKKNPADPNILSIFHVVWYIEGSKVPQVNEDADRILGYISAMVTAMWTSAIIKEPDNYWGKELFFFCLSTIKWVENSQQRKKRKKKRQPNSWLLVCGIHKYKAKWENVSWHDCHIPKETTNVFTNEEHTLPWQPSPKEVALTLLAHKWKGPARSSVAEYPH